MCQALLYFVLYHFCESPLTFEVVLLFLNPDLLVRKLRFIEVKLLA